MPLGMLGKYERLDVLGHGASGIVYLAKDTLLGRQVALKEVAAQGEDKDRFLGEARVLDRLRHPNIVQVIGVDEIDGKIAIAMEYVRGRSLQDILRATPQLPVGDAVNIAAQICDGLAFAHSQRTVHRDIKPANILVDHSGLVKLVDFGLAEVLGTHSLAGGAGTYSYMAPEDFHEEEYSDRRSDIWAVGVILYEILAGRRPFQVAKAKDPFAWKRVIEEDAPIPISDLRSDAPPEIDAIIDRALAKDKKDRYADADAMAADLRSLATGAESDALHTHSDWKIASPAFGDSDLPTVADRPSQMARQATDFAAPRPHLPDFPGVTEIDGFLKTALDHWPQARAALVGGGLERWLIEIGENPLAAVAQEIAAAPAENDDDRLRDFLYRAGLETVQEAQDCYDAGERLYREGRFTDSVEALRRAARLDPTHAEYHQSLAQALRATGDTVGAALALEQIIGYHAVSASLAGRSQSPPGSQVSLSTHVIQFGSMRQGQTRSARVVIRNIGRGVLQGRVASAPRWLRVEPWTFTTRQKQPLTLTAVTYEGWQAPAAYQEQVVLETNGERHEITVIANVLPARLDLGQALHWYLPLLICCLLPGLATAIATWMRILAPNQMHAHAAMHDIWQPGCVASGLLCGSLFIVAFAADTIWTLRVLPLLGVCLFISVFASGGFNSADTGMQTARVAAFQGAAPVLVLLVLQAIAVAVDPRGWGRWQIWRWIVGAAGVLIAYALLHIG